MSLLMISGWHRVCLQTFNRRINWLSQHQNFRTNAVCYSKDSESFIIQKIVTEDFPPPLIRNFSIIAHIDHGKSTLSDRLLELTGTIPKNESSVNKQVLDKLKVERERGITVKAQTVSMIHTSRGSKFLLNLIDTPGHVDFAWEVSRSLVACQGAVLLVDASQGVQAQSISVFHIAQARGLKIIPVMNKVDLPTADPVRVMAQMQSTFGFDPADVLCISAKTGKGVEAVLEAIVTRIPFPVDEAGKPLKALIFDSSYDRYRGVVSLVKIVSGKLRKGDKISSCRTSKKYEVIEVGVLHPEEVAVDVLYLGQVGYVTCNMKDSAEAHIGDTLFRVGEPVEPLPGFTPAKPMVYAGVYPVDSNDFLKMEESIKRLALTDRSVSIQRESSSALGQGCRIGFLGTLHMDVFRQRLEYEYDAQIIITAPTVPYKVIYRNKEEFITNPTNFPDTTDPVYNVLEVQEPYVSATIITPEEYIGDIMELCFSHRGEEMEHRYLDTSKNSARLLLTCQLPLSEIVTEFFDKLKGRSSGFASFDYEDAGYRRSDLAKMRFLLNAKPVDALALIVHRSAQQEIGRLWVKKLHKVIPRQLFEVPIQAIIGKKVIARETLSAMRADVTAGLYGGHFERKLKHLENQKEGKRRLKKIGSVELPQEAFFDVLSTKQSK